MAASEHEPGNQSRQLSGKSLSRREQWVLAGLLVFTLVVRGSVLWFMRGNLEQDPDAYREIAENLIVHGEFALGNPQAGDWHPRPTAYRPPLYPVVLSNLPAADGQQHVSLFRVAVLHLVLGVATVWLTWGTARRVGYAHHCAHVVGPAHPTGLWLPLVAGLVVACDPILLNQQTLVMTETLAAFLAVLSLWCLARFDGARTPFNAALAGGAIGLAVLCRPTFLPWLGLVGVAMVLIRGRISEFRIQNSEFRWFSDVGWRMANVVALLVMAAVVVSPWAIRNYRVFGKPIVTTTHGGYTLLLGNNRYFFDWLSSSGNGVPWNSDVLSRVMEDNRLFMNWQHWRALEASQLNEADNDRWCYELARSEIRAEPTTFALACAYRLGQLWSPLPHRLTADESMARRWLRYATCGWYCGVYALVVMGVGRFLLAHGTPRRAFPTAVARGVAVLVQPPWVWGVLLCVAFTAVHTFYWTNLRMRAPLMPFVAMVAAAGMEMIERRRDRKIERP